jgi:hypothetical protein
MNYSAFYRSALLLVATAMAEPSATKSTKVMKVIIISTTLLLAKQ